MVFRKLLLRVMLWSLLLAAICGVLTVLFSGHETAWRVVGTMIVTALAAGLMMWMSLLSEREKTREAGLLGMAMVIAEWVGAEALIWDVRGGMGWGYRFEENLAFTMLLGAATATLAMLSMGVWRRRGFVVAGRVGLAVAIVVAALWVFGLWWPSDGSGWYLRSTSLKSKAMLSSWAVAVMGVLASSLLFGVPKVRWWTVVGLIAAAATLAMWLMAIWMEIDQSNGTTECIASVAVLAAFCNAMRLVRLRDAQQGVVWGTMAVAVATTILLDAVILLDKQNAEIDLLGRLAAAGGILVGCGTLAIAVLSRLNRHDVRPTEMPNVTDMAAVCPVCQKRQRLAMGESRCEGCGLIFDIRVKEPRCRHCNYLLLMLKSDRCPECGELVGQV